jgi:hypothetical protein
MAKKLTATMHQINLRIELLRSLIEGTLKLDARHDLSTLSKIRDLEMPSHGIRLIPSPNSFTTTHKDYGDAVIVVQELKDQLYLGDLAAKPVDNSHRISPKQQTIDGQTFTIKSLRDERHTILANWHLARQEAQDAAHLKDEVGRLTKMLDQKDREIADLRRRLSERSLRLVK